MSAGKHIIVFVTAKDGDEAKKISLKLVEEKLVACANIVHGVSSIFFWEGKVDKADEVLLVLKSKKSLFNKIIAAVKLVHSYTCPEIIAIPIVDGNKDYLRWIDASVR